MAIAPTDGWLLTEAGEELERGASASTPVLVGLRERIRLKDCAVWLVFGGLDARAGSGDGSVLAESDRSRYEEKTERKGM